MKKLYVQIYLTVVASLVLAAVVPLLLLAALAAIASRVLSGPAADVAEAVAAVLPAVPFLVGLLFVDTVMTVFFCAVAPRRPHPSMVLFPLLRVWDAVLCLRALLAALGRPSDGRWKSPDRRAVAPVARADDDDGVQTAALSRPSGSGRGRTVEVGHELSA